MNYSRATYIGKAIQLYPGDTYSKFGIITNVDDLGWTIKIIKSSDKTTWKVGQEYFISHSRALTFEFI